MKHFAMQISLLILLWGTPAIVALRRPRVLSRLLVRNEKLQLDIGLSVRGGEQQNSQTCPNAAISLRGGESTAVSGFFESLIKAVEQQSPVLASYVESFLISIESLTGFRLLPEKKEKSKKKKRKQKKKAALDDEEVDEGSLSTKKKNKKSSTKKPSAKKKKKTSSAAAASSKSTLESAHVQKELKATSPNYRIQRELKAFLSDPPTNLKVKVGKNLRVWIVKMTGAKDTIYQGETFQLRIAFPAQYPTVPPSVYFLPPNIPVHEHVYTNGDICLSLLGKDWRPTMTAQSIAVSILSILSSAQSKSLPMDNARHAQNKPGQYQKDWVYHDDNC
mmetsp:Transcript_7438/g.15167  ORF Transcript_7438/g.15167 Transcript_7438/m.15167 type:complete len:333 (-) Transcript_7438:22-1020(-)